MQGKRMTIMISIVMGVFLSTAVVAKEKVTVYTSLETDETVKYLEVARKDLPDLDIDIIRLSTGELGARMLAEMGCDQHGAVHSCGNGGTL
jgi:iron(III) transport system substrate-binding protein